MPFTNKPKYALSLLVIIGLMFFSLSSLAQGKFNIEGIIKIEKGSLDGTSVTIEKNGEEVGSRSCSSSSKVELQLEYNSSYILTFKKSGYVTKKLLFETKAPSDRQEEGFEPFKFNIVLFKQYEGVNTVVFNQPVGKIYYNQDNDEFAYDTDYTKSIQAQINEVMKEVAEKQVEEEKKPAPKPEPPAQVVKTPEPPKPEPPKPIVQAPVEPAPIPKQEAPKPVAPAPAPVVQAPAPRPKPVVDIVESAPKSTYVKPQVAPEKPYTPYIPPGEKIIMSFFTTAQYGSSDTTFYGYINYGDGKGLQALRKEDFVKYRGQYYDK